ncbi:MAG: YihY family inner membrane protein [Chitinispirillaceae bacterium]|nr:YihY family inner membrane protein [Chitinispirillaceae bacterium]
MYLFTKKFRDDFRHDPREAIDSLKRQKNHVWYRMIKWVVFWRIVLAEYRLNHNFTRSSALAYVLLLTLIPLVVTGAFMLGAIIDIQPRQVAQAFATFLPFAPETVLDYLSRFYDNARKIRGPGIVILIIVAIGLFGVAEESFNTIWKVTRQRSLFFRLVSFTMAMVYSPILFSLSFVIRHTGWFEAAAERFFPIDALPFVLMTLAFTSLIWFVPNTKVRFGSALLGGLAAAVLFEAERQGFGMFVQMSIQAQTIYGTLGILPLFLVSLYVGCIIMLFGTQIAYVHQNFRPLLRAQKRWDRRVGDYRTYLTFRIFTDAVGAFIRKKQPPTLRYFIRTYELTEPQAAGLLNWLVHADLLHCTRGKRGDGYVPTRDFSKQPVGAILDEIKSQDLRITSTPDDYTREFVASLINNSHGPSTTPAEQMTFETLVATIEDGEKRLARASSAA